MQLLRVAARVTHLTLLKKVKANELLWVSAGFKIGLKIRLQPQPPN